MTSLNVVEQGLSYLRACLNLYSGECAFLVLYVIALIWVCARGTKLERRVFIPSGVLLLVTVYNPLFPVMINRFFDVNNEYYRFFWITPVVILLPYAAAKLVMMMKDRSSRWIMAVALVILMILSGNFIYRNGYQKAENIYKMPSELMEIADLIHEQSDKVYPQVLLEYEYNMQMRQYDPKILLTIDREDYLYANTHDYSGEMISDEDHPQYKLLGVIARNQTIDIMPDDFAEALEKTHTEYVVIGNDSLLHKYMGLAGLYPVATTENHVIYKYDLIEPYAFELVDYTPVY